MLHKLCKLSVFVHSGVRTLHDCVIRMLYLKPPLHLSSCCSCMVLAPYQKSGPSSIADVCLFVPMLSYAG